MTSLPFPFLGGRGHLSDSFKAQIKAYFLETFDLAHWEHSFFKSKALHTELFIWYLIICNLALLSVCESYCPDGMSAPWSQTWFTFLCTLQSLPSFPLTFPHSCLPSSFLHQHFCNTCVGYCGCLWISYLLPPGNACGPWGQVLLPLVSLCVIYGLLNYGTNIVLLTFISLLFLLLSPWNSPFSISASPILVSSS